MVAENLEIVRQRITEVCRRCGRDPDQVILLAVSKTFPPDTIREAIAAGQHDFGENYVQELLAKRDALGSESVRWHFIGHLQTNKVRSIVDFVHLIHSVDSVRLIEEIHRRAERIDRQVDVLLEVHTTDEATKSGVAPGAVLDLVKDAVRFDRVRIRGLMTMGPFSDDPNDSRPCFQTVRALRDRIEQEGIAGVRMDTLSMGMTHDFDVAIEEGAPIVRIGTAIFGRRRRPSEPDHGGNAQ